MDLSYPVDMRARAALHRVAVSVQEAQDTSFLTFAYLDALLLDSIGQIETVVEQARVDTQDRNELATALSALREKSAELSRRFRAIQRTNAPAVDAEEDDAP